MAKKSGKKRDEREGKVKKGDAGVATKGADKRGGSTSKQELSNKDYARALKEFTMVSGPIPMVPRYVLGSWFSRYWPYADHEYKAIIEDAKFTK